MSSPNYDFFLNKSALDSNPDALVLYQSLFMSQATPTQKNKTNQRCVPCEGTALDQSDKRWAGPVRQADSWFDDLK